MQPAPPQQQQNRFENPTVVLQRVKEVIDKNKASDLFHKAFLRPQQIALKTWRTENDTSKPHDALPYGLKQVIKKDIQLNKYILKDFQSFDSLQPSQRNIQYIVQNNYDNLLSLLKPRGQQQKIQLCICICMYSQDKTMLRKTLAGVSNNIATFVQNGISADDIVVAVVMDGIEKVHPSVIDFFGEMEKQSNIYLDDDIEGIEAREMVREEGIDVDQEEVININNFIFDEIQFEDRKKRRFAERKKEYEQVKATRSKIEKLELNKRVTFYDLDPILKPFFFEKAKQYRKKQYADQNFQTEKITQEQLIQQYAQNIRKSRPIIFQALSEAKSYCDKYIQTRDNLALLNSFRFQVNFGSFDKKKKDKNYQKLQEQQKVGNVKMNLFFITKYKNSGKLSSHNWFFNGLCRQIRSQFSVLLDVGLSPQRTALYKMYDHMKQDAKCGGVCGYMNLRIERLQEQDQRHYVHIDWLSRLFLHCVDIQRAQQVQYHFAHLIDKPFQALFRFIHVLPGAFSAYRMKALQPNQQQDSKLMRQYFKSLEQQTSRQLKKSQYSTGKAILKVLLPDFLFYCCYPPPKQLTQQQLLYDSNVFLAEDRTLCMGIHQNGYELQYLPDSHAWVDPIKNLHGLLGQRKRWINGSFFAFESVKRGLSSQSKGGQCCLKLQIFYLTLMNMLAFVSPALFLFTVHIAMFAFRDWFFGLVLNNITNTTFQTTQFYNSFVYVMDFIYVMLLLGLVFKSIHFTHRTQRFIPFVYIMSTIMGMFSIAVFIVLLVDMIIGIIDSIQCLNNSTTCSITFLAENPVLRSLFFKALPGGVFSFMIYKWLVVGVMLLYAVPILVYAIFYCRCQFLADVIFGTFSFIFYTPTYLNILNTFALCRIDDISWGTKGLDAEDNRNRQLKQSWKAIKILHVAKFIFWNVIVGAAMLIISSPINLTGVITPQQYNNLLVDAYVRKFFMTFFLMAIIGFALFLKIILGAMYSISYRCSHHKSEKKILRGGPIRNDSRADKYFYSIKGSMDDQLRQYIHGMVDNVKKKTLAKGLSINDFNSLIIANKKFTDGQARKKAIQKWNNNVSNRSKVVKKSEDKKKPRPANPTNNQAINLNFNANPNVRNQPQPQPQLQPQARQTFGSPNQPVPVLVNQPVPNKPVIVNQPAVNEPVVNQSRLPNNQPIVNQPPPSQSRVSNQPVPNQLLPNQPIRNQSRIPTQPQPSSSQVPQAYLQAQYPQPQYSQPQYPQPQPQPSQLQPQYSQYPQGQPPPRRLPQTPQQISKNELKSNIEQMNSQAEIRKSNYDMERQPYNIDRRDRSKTPPKKIFGLF